MNGTTHMIVGGLTGGLVFVYGIANHSMSLNFSGYEIYTFVVTVAGAVGGLAPDVDMRQSKAGKSLRKLLKTVMIISTVFLAAMPFISETGIKILDRAVSFGASVDQKVPIVLVAFCILLMIVIEKSKHRGFTHTLVALFIVALPLFYMLYTKTVFIGADIVVSAQIGFVLGWFSHMLIDTFNYPGTPWLWPVVNNHFNIMRVDSGTIEETRFLVICVVVFIAGYTLILV